jgi:hypothetical protein
MALKSEIVRILDKKGNRGYLSTVHGIAQDHKENGSSNFARMKDR